MINRDSDRWCADPVPPAPGSMEINPPSPLPIPRLPDLEKPIPQPVQKPARPVLAPPPVAGSLLIRTETNIQRNASDLPSDELQVMVQIAPPWLLSMIFHMTLLIILGLCMFTPEIEDRVELEIGITDELGSQLEKDSFDSPDDSLLQVSEQVLTPDVLPTVDDQFGALPELDMFLRGSISTSRDEAPVIGHALKGRMPEMKKSLLTAYGGNETTETAVHNSLAWLVRNQRKNGSWSLMGPYADGGITENSAAATAMALLAFQGAGHTHLGGKKAPFALVVERGWNWLLKQQDREGRFSSGGPTNHNLYTHAQATIALCELYGMTRDKRYKEPAERAVQYAIETQDPYRGGWKYFPKKGSDTSVTGWFVMALQSARMAGIPVPKKVFKKVDKFLDTVALKEHYGSRFSYEPGSYSTPAMSAEGLLCRQYLGWRHKDARLLAGVDYLNEIGMDWDRRDAYFWYYATQVCHHMEGDPWEQWNRVMRRLLPQKQLRRGRERGSWDPAGDQWGTYGGRLYVTCLHAYCLEVYYRHLPLYQGQNFQNQQAARQ